MGYENGVTQSYSPTGLPLITEGFALELLSSEIDFDHFYTVVQSILDENPYLALVIHNIVSLLRSEVPNTIEGLHLPEKLNKEDLIGEVKLTGVYQVLEVRNTILEHTSLVLLFILHEQSLYHLQNSISYRDQGKGRLTSSGLPFLSAITYEQVINFVNNKIKEGNGQLLGYQNAHPPEDHLYHLIDGIAEVYGDVLAPDIKIVLYYIIAILETQHNIDAELPDYMKNGLPVLHAEDVDLYHKSRTRRLLPNNYFFLRTNIKNDLNRWNFFKITNPDVTIKYILTLLGGVCTKNEANKIFDRCMHHLGDLLTFLYGRDLIRNNHSNGTRPHSNALFGPPYITDKVLNEAMRRYPGKLWPEFMNEVQERLLRDNPYLVELMYAIVEDYQDEELKKLVLQMMMGFIALNEYKGR